jgi:hypothetical protein
MIKRTITITLKEEDYEDFIKFCNEDYELEEDEDLEEVATQMLEDEPVENLSCCFSVRYEDETW